MEQKKVKAQCIIDAMAEQGQRPADHIDYITRIDPIMLGQLCEEVRREWGTQSGRVGRDILSHMIANLEVAAILRSQGRLTDVQATCYFDVLRRLRPVLCAVQAVGVGVPESVARDLEATP